MQWTDLSCSARKNKKKRKKETEFKKKTFKHLLLEAVGGGGGQGGVNNLKGNADDILRDEPEYERLHTADTQTTVAALAIHSDSSLDVCIGGRLSDNIGSGGQLERF